MTARGLSVAAVLLVLLSWLWWQAARGPVLDPAAREAVDDFFGDYVADGRVHRSEGDTVSEGQAYALLMAVAADMPEEFARVWEWTRGQLLRSDGAMAWRWDGGVVDDGMAPDADVDAAVALYMAAERFSQPSYARAAQRMARAVLESSTAPVGDRLHLTGGEWVDSTDIVINPSYLDAASFEFLGRRTGDERWYLLAKSARAVLTNLAAEGLPPDWAVIDDDAIRPIASPDQRDGPGLFGFDALRVPIRAATRCTASVAAALAETWPEVADRPGVAIRHLDGRPAEHWTHPAAYVASAALARTVEPARVDDLLAKAEAENREQPSYYGAAWIALGRLLLTTTTLERCR